VLRPPVDTRAHDRERALQCAHRQVELLPAARLASERCSQLDTHCWTASTGTGLSQTPSNFEPAGEVATAIPVEQLMFAAAIGLTSSLPVRSPARRLEPARLGGPATRYRHEPAAVGVERFAALVEELDLGESGLVQGRDQRIAIKDLK
jgi:hypothetical protein